MKVSRNKQRKKRHLRIRKKLFGTVNRPRLNVFRSNNYIYAQIINDEKGFTLISASSLETGVGKKLAGKKGVVVAFEIGKMLAQRADKVGIKKVVFDRSGYKYHGRVKALAEGAREGGLRF